MNTHFYFDVSDYPLANVIDDSVVIMPAVGLERRGSWGFLDRITEEDELEDALEEEDELLEENSAANIRKKKKKKRKKSKPSCSESSAASEEAASEAESHFTGKNGYNDMGHNGSIEQVIFGLNLRTLMH